MSTLELEGCAPMSERPRHSARRTIAVGLLSVFVGFSVARCGAQNVDAPPDVETGSTGSSCKSFEDTMPEFFTLLRDPRQPLAGIREVIEGLAAGQNAKLKNSALGALLSTALAGLTNFAKDPKELNGGCVKVSVSIAPPTAPLCTITSAQPCESRLCSLRRALDFGIRDRGGSQALNELTPLLAKALGYLSNTGPGADGRPHYEMFEVLNRTSRNEARCAPANLLDVLDGVVVYFRSNRACGNDCQGLKALQAIDDLLRDPALQSFLDSYQDSDGTGKGRESFQALGKVLGQAFANMPEDEHYFDSIQKVVDTLVQFLDSDKDHKYEGLKQKILVVVDLFKQVLDPKRPDTISAQLKAVVGCLTVVDANQEVVGALYDLLSRPGGADGKGIDIKEFFDALHAVAKLDTDGVLMGALHTILASIRADEANMNVLRLFLVDFITVENAKKLLPALQLMLQRGVLSEALSLIDGLVYGCQPVGSQ
jgi:hypothetical protein